MLLLSNLLAKFIRHGTLHLIDADGGNPVSLTDTRDVTEIAWGP